MKRTTIGLSQHYVTALRKHLKEGARADLAPALALGRQAVAEGKETLELARVHEQALVLLKLSAGQTELIKRAEMFFTEAITQIDRKSTCLNSSH